MTLVRLVSLFLAATAVACGGSLEEAPPAESQPTPTINEPTYVTLNLVGADVEMTLKGLADLTERSLVIEPDAAALVSCAAPLDVRRDSKVTTQEAVKLVAEAVQPSGLVVVEEPLSLIVKKAPNARPCPS